MKHLEYIVDSRYEGRELKLILKNQMSVSRRLVTDLKFKEGIRINGIPARTNTIVHTGDIVEVVFVEEELNIPPEEIPLDIIYEDASILVVNKPGNMVVHPSMNHSGGTLCNAVAGHYQAAGIQSVVRPVNRLDNGTSGIVIFAKNSFVQQRLIDQMQQKVFSKEYLGFVCGIPPCEKGTIDLPIARKEGSIMERIVSPSGQHAVTHYEMVKSDGHRALVRFVLETGRTHQIRVHTMTSGFPLAGDSLYGGMLTDIFPRQALHATKVSFIHPATGNMVAFESDLPDDIKSPISLFMEF